MFEDVVADPPSHVIEAAVALCRERRIEAVVSVGGGSALDTAKLVAYLAQSDDRLDDIYGVGLAKGQRLPLLLAPTTAGTGSEVTPIAIVTTPTTEKKGVVSPRLLPDWAILDPELTLGLPPPVTAATGIDAMVHAIEAYTSRHKKNPISDQLARQALALLSREHPRGLPQRHEPRGPVGDAARLDAGRHGLRQRARGCRACARLSDRRDVPRSARAVQRARAHGRAALQPARGRGSLCRTCPDRRPGGTGSAPGATPRAPSWRRSASICRDCGVPSTLAEVGIREEDLDRLAEDAMKQTRLLVNNPREVTYADAYAIYSEALDGKLRQAALSDEEAHPMNPFESMQSLAMLWGKAAGQAFRQRSTEEFKDMADALRPCVR